MNTRCKAALIEAAQRQDLQQVVHGILRQSRHAALASSATAFALLLAAGAAQAQKATAPAAAGSRGQEPALEEIVVTAQRRTESLQNVPYNISAIAGDDLREAGVVSMAGLTKAVPGLQTVDQGPASRGGNNNFTLRGLRTNPPGGGGAGLLYHNLTVSPVSTYFGETPVFFQMPLDDLERVEVLRGPQGTLYGSGAQAGTIRFVPRRPKLGEYSGEVSVDASATSESSDPSGSIHGVFNIPLGNTAALRLVAGEDHLAGFVDAVDRAKLGADGVPLPSIPGDLTSGFVLDSVKKDVNSSDQWFARAALRWQPNDALDLQLDYLHEHTSMKDGQWGSSWKGGAFDSSFGIWPNATVVMRPGCKFCSTNLQAEPYSDKVDLVDLVATMDVGLGTITAASSYYDDQNSTTFDQTGNYYGIPNPPSPDGSNFLPYFPYLGYPRVISMMYQPSGTRAFVQELRLVSNKGKRFDYVAGLYYQHQDDFAHLDQFNAGSTAYLDAIGQHNPTVQGDKIYLRYSNTTFVDKALFGELTYHLTPAWQMTAGVRFFKQTYTSSVFNQLPLCGAPCAADQVDINGTFVANDSTSVSSSVKKFNTSYDFSPTLKVYGTYSEGFRHGGVSGLPTLGPFASRADLEAIKPDLAKNYEIGVKGSLLGHRIRYFADLYLIDLTDFQFDSGNPSAVTGAFNGKDARSKGLELELEAALTDRLNVGFGYAYTKSYVKTAFDIQDYPPYALFGGNGQTVSLFGGPIPAGAKLPGVSEHVANASIEYTLPAGSLGNGDWSWRFHLDGSYRSAQNSSINPASFFQFVIPSAFLANAQVSLTTSKSLSYQFFVRNITNNADISGGVNDQLFSNPYRLRNVGRPRTIGLGLKFQF